MKWWQAFALAGILTVIFGLPFREYSTKQLLPIKTLQARRQEGEIRILSEAGEGRGESWEAAVRDLEEKAPGEVFFDTAEQAVFSDKLLAREAAESGILRPAARVYFSSRFSDPEELYAVLSAHPGRLQISDLTGREYYVN